MLKRLGKYEILAELGQGAMGVVYSAKDPMIGRKVALKTITAALSEKTDLRDRFFREAQAAGGLNHPNIVTVFDLGVENQTPYIAMEFIEGDSLEKLIANKTPMALAQKVSYFVQVCRGLAYAHERGVVHRDIKPANVMINKEDVVKVVDFGIARLTAASHTQTGMMIGTIAYMSPEQVQGHHVDGRSDIWSAGVTFYEFLTMNRPFTADNLAAVMFNIVSPTSKPIALKHYLPEVPDDLQHLMDRVFQKNPDDRYQTMEDVLLDLEPILKRLQTAGVSDMVEQGRSLLASGAIEKARDLIRSAIQLDSGNRPARDLLEKINQEAKRQRLVPELKEKLNKAEQLLSQGKLPEAASEVESALRMDSAFAPAQEMMQRVRNEMTRVRAVEDLIKKAEHSRESGDVTSAEMTIDQLLAQYGQDRRALELKRQIQESRERRQQQREFEQKKQEARQLWGQQNYEECIGLLEQLAQQAPHDTEVRSLLEAARADQAEDQKQKHLAEAKRLLGAQKFAESLQICETLLQVNPNDSGVQRLRTQVLQLRAEQERKARQQGEIEALKKLFADGRFAEVLPRAEAHLKEFTDDFEVRHLLENARARREEQERRKQCEEKKRNIEALLAAGQVAQAITESEHAMLALPEFKEFDDLLGRARAKEKEQKERETHEFIARQISAMQSAIDKDNPTEAMKIGQQTIVRVGESKEVTQLLRLAEHHHEEKAKSKERDKQLQTAFYKWNEGKFDEAQKTLEDLQKTHIFDARIGNLLDAVKQKQPPPAETMFGELGAFKPAEEAAPQADRTYVFQQAGSPAAAGSAQQSGPQNAAAPPAMPADGTAIFQGMATPSAEPPVEDFGISRPMIEIKQPGKKKKKDKFRARIADDEAPAKWEEEKEAAAPGLDPDATARWREPLLPPEEPKPAYDPEATAKFTEPLAGKPPAAPPAAAGFDATRIGSLEDVKAPPPAPPKMPPAKTPPAAEFTATTVAPPEKIPPKMPPGKPAEFTATTVAPADKMAGAPPKTPAADFTATTVAPRGAAAPPPAAGADFTATTVAPAEKKRDRARPAPTFEERIPTPRPSRAEPEMAPTDLVAAEPKKSSMGLIAGGVGVAVIAIALVVWAPWKPSTPSDAAPASSGASSTGSPTGSDTSTPPTGVIGTTPTASSAPSPMMPAPAVDPKTTPEGKEQFKLLQQAQRLLGKGDFKGAQPAFQRAKQAFPTGPYVADIDRGLKAIETASSNAAVAAAMAEDSKFFDEMSNLAAKDTSRDLERAIGIAESRIAAKGPRIDDFVAKKAELEGRLATVRKTEEVAPILSDGLRALGRNDFAGARAKAAEAQGRGGDATGLLSRIAGEEQKERNELDGRFQNAGKNVNALRSLQNDYRKLAYSGGSQAGHAQDMIDNRIPAAIREAETPVVVAPPPKQDVPVARACPPSFAWMGTAQKATGVIGPNSFQNEGFIDGGGPKFQGTPSVSTSIQQQGCGKGVVLKLTVNESGKITAANVFGPDPGFGKALADEAARTWQFAPPKVDNKPVKTIATYRVSF